jgi:alcohol dehydrogenase class IV
VNFEFGTTPFIVFGPGSLGRLGEQAARFGRRAWLVTGAAALERAGVLGRAEQWLAEAGVSAVRQVVTAEPDTALVDRGRRDAVASGCDLVIGMGGGSVLDAAKSVACLMANGGEAIDYLEVVGRGAKIGKPSVPLIAVPTTAGTGSEATRNSVLADPATGTKASLRHEYLLPRVALLDPTLTHSLPREVTARSGLDALIQLIEPYVSRREHPMIDVLALEGIRRASRALPRAWADADDAAARADMMLAALWSGMALAHCGLGAAHGFAGPLGGSFPIPHGTACAATMPHVMAANLSVAGRDPGGTETIRRYANVARAMGLAGETDDLSTARRGAARMRELCSELGIPGLRAFGVTPEVIPDLVTRAKRTSSMKANPVDLSEEDLAGILEQALG